MLKRLTMISIAFILLHSTFIIVSSEDYLAEFDDLTETKKFGSGTPSSSRNYDASISNLGASRDSYSNNIPTAKSSAAVVKSQPEVANSNDIEELPPIPKSSAGGCGGEGSQTKSNACAPGISPCQNTQGCGSTCNSAPSCGINAGSCGSTPGCGNTSPCGTPILPQPCQSRPYYPQVKANFK